MSSSTDARPDADRAPSPDPGHGRLAGLDGLRALAVVAVVVFHFAPTWLPGGFLGVDLFFVISGYLITRLLLAEVQRTGRLAIGAFYLRRIRRLFPAILLLLIAVTIACLIGFHDELSDLRGTVVASLAYVTNWWFIADHQSYFVSAGRPSMLQHLWSLAIEEQFYLVWPWVVALATTATITRRRSTDSARGHGAITQIVTDRVVRISLIGAAASTGLMAFIAIAQDIPYSHDSNRVYFGTDTHAMGLLLGAMFGALAVRGTLSAGPKRLRGSGLTDLAGVAALVAFAVVVATVGESDVGLYRGGFLLIAGVCAVAVAAAPRPGSRLGAALDRAPLRYVGSRSYGIYLWHWPVAVAFRPGFETTAPIGVVFAIRLALTLLLAEASFRLVERPIRTGGLAALAGVWRLSRLDVRRGRFAAAWSVAAVLAVAGVVAAGADTPTRASGPQAEPVVSLPPPPTFTVPVPAPVERPTPSGSAASSRAAPPPPAPRRKVTAVSAFGDSVMLGASATLIASLPHTTVDAIEGRQARDVLSDVVARKADRTLAPVVIIHVGDNGFINHDDLVNTLTALRDRQRVVLLNDHVSRDWQNPNNVTLLQVTKSYPNVVLIDWFDLSNQHPEWFYEDGLHLRGPGVQGYTALVLKAVYTA